MSNGAVAQVALGYIGAEYDDGFFAPDDVGPGERPAADDMRGAGDAHGRHGEGLLGIACTGQQSHREQ